VIYSCIHRVQTMIQGMLVVKLRASNDQLGGNNADSAAQTSNAEMR
jgi:hypothetical protein